MFIFVILFWKNLHSSNYDCRCGVLKGVLSDVLSGPGVPCLYSVYRYMHSFHIVYGHQHFDLCVNYRVYKQEGIIGKIEPFIVASNTQEHT